MMNNSGVIYRIYKHSTWRDCARCLDAGQTVATVRAMVARAVQRAERWPDPFPARAVIIQARRDGLAHALSDYERNGGHTYQLTLEWEE